MRLIRAMPETVRQRAVRAVSPSYTCGSQARVIREDGRILLVKAAYRWRWGLPGGLMDAQEGPHAAVIREVREETGLDAVTVGDPLVVVETEMRRINFVYDARPAEGVDPDALRPQASEIREIGWFGFDELPEIIPDRTRDVIQPDGVVGQESRLFVTNEFFTDPPTS